MLIMPPRPSHLPHNVERTALQLLNRTGAALPALRLYPASRRTIAGMLNKGWIESRRPGNQAWRRHASFDNREFRRCPTCRRVEVGATDEPVFPGIDHDRCGLLIEQWVHFRAPPGWRLRRRWEHLDGHARNSCMVEEHVTRQTPLAFEIELVDGSTIKTVGDIETYLRHLNADQHLNSHWGIAVRMFANAMHEPAYLKTATMSFQTALALDGMLVRMQ